MAPTCGALPRIRLILTAALGAVAIAVPAAAATLYVANNGADSPSCGVKEDPCRSISRAIANAIAGDTLIVGPGRYGDLDGDSDFDDPGEETGPGQGCACAVFVSKRLTIQSRDGAATTIVDGAGVQGRSVVRIAPAASGTVFGKKRKGFTIRNGGIGILTDGGVNGATITSNIATANGGSGFIILGSTGVQITGNLATGNGLTGVGGQGFDVSGNNHVLSGNVSTANNGNGFTLTVFSSTTVTGNVASANVFRGFSLNDGPYLFKGNSAIGNLGSGIATFGGATGVVTKNNAFGNNAVVEFGLTNCGIRNFSGALDASKNFWGAATGPGPDPADDACASGGGTTITTAPFATKEIKVKRLP